MHPRLEEILSAHECESDSAALSGNFGDAFLCVRNPMFRRIRELSLSNGLTFSVDEHSGYQMPILLQAWNKPASKVVGYKDNVSVLTQIEASRPGKFLFPEIPPVASNQVFYASALRVAIQAQGSTDRAKACLLANSFASACEAAGHLFKGDEHHRYFYLYNSNVAVDPGFVAFGKHTMGAAGLRKVFELIFAAFLRSNMGSHELGTDNFEDAANWLDGNGRGIKAAEIPAGISVTKPLQPELAELFFRATGQATVVRSSDIKDSRKFLCRLTDLLFAA